MVTNTIKLLSLFSCLFLFSFSANAGVDDKEEVIIPADEEDEGVGGGNAPGIPVYNLDALNLVPNSNNNGATGFFPTGMHDAILRVYDLSSAWGGGALPSASDIIYETSPFNEYDYNIDEECGRDTDPMYTIVFDLQSELEDIYCGTSSVTLTHVVVAMTYDTIISGSTVIKKYPYKYYPNQFSSCADNYTALAEQLDHTSFYYSSILVSCSSNGGNNGSGESDSEVDTDEETSTVVETTEVEATTLFPNPVSDILNIQSKSEIIEVQIYDNAGKLMVNQSSSFNNGINMSGIRDGMYYVKIHTEDGIEFEKIFKLSK